MDRSFGMPPANNPPNPGAEPTGGAGVDIGGAALPALLARARVPGTAGGLNPELGTAGAPPTGAITLVVGLTKLNMSTYSYLLARCDHLSALFSELCLFEFEKARRLERVVQLGQVQGRAELGEHQLQVFRRVEEGEEEAHHPS